jgi:ketosteroid isomerase-like protein
MAEQTPVNSINPSKKTVPVDPERTLATPRFDDKSVQRARPALPLGAQKGRRFLPSSLWALCLVAALAGIVIGGLGFILYHRTGATASPTMESDDATASQTAERATANEEPAVAPPLAERAEKRSPSSGNNPVSSARAARPVSGEQAKEAARPSPERDGEDSRPSGNRVAEEARHSADEEQAALRGALDEWVAATNARDIGRQMNFYSEEVGAYYRSRNVPRSAVRAEKARVFGNAAAIDIRAAAPDIRISRDGSAATMRFRKKYAIAGGGEDRRGEVLQELRWRRTKDGWKIVGERDLRVID